MKRRPNNSAAQMMDVTLVANVSGRYYEAVSRWKTRGVIREA